MWLVPILSWALSWAACSDPPPPPPEAPPEPVVAAPAFEPGDKLTAALKKVPADWKAKNNPRAGDEAALAAGEAIYAEDCAACHGVKGDGDGPAAMALPQRPSDFTDAARWAATSDGEKAWLLKSGIPGTSMAPRDLEEDALWAALAFVENSFQNAE